jgi:2-polyprenyl-3-methyl-5-hydroxy-6-metoxy-1,4-benzoquinol methylase
MTQHEHGEKKSLEFKQLEWTDDNVARFWRWQGQFPATYFTYQFGRQIADRLRAPLAGRISIIDYGCGPGFLIPHLSALGKEVTATDFSPDALDNANRNYGNLESFKGALSIERLVESSTRFDAAVSIETIEHLNDAYLAGFFRNLHTILKPEGIAIITTPNDENLDLSMIYCPESDRVFHRWQHVRSWSAESLYNRFFQTPLRRHQGQGQAHRETPSRTPREAAASRLHCAPARLIGCAASLELLGHRKQAGSSA